MIKKLFTICTDISLFSFLLIIFIVPILVSFNLDPQLYEAEKADVAGVSDSSATRNFHVNEKLITTARVNINETSLTGDKYTVDITIEGGENLYENIQLGVLQNEADLNKTYLIRLIANKAELEFITITTDEYVLFDENGFHEAIIQLNKNSTQTLKLQISSEIAIRFPFSLFYEISEKS